jgi:hypothetical protein
MNLYRFTRALAGAAVFAVAAASSLAPAPALAASVVMTGVTCSWSDANQTLTCSGAGGTTAPPVCSISGVQSAPVNGSVTLTANCTNAPTSYQWAGAACTPSGAQCTATSASQGVTSYVVKAGNAGGMGEYSLAQSVTWSNSAVLSCALGPAGPTTPGTSVALSLSCSGGTPAVTWSATGPGTATFGNTQTGPGIFSNTVAFSAAGLYTVTATPTGATPTTTAVQVNAVTVAPSGGNICAAYGFSKTIRSTWDWASNSSHSLDTYVTPDTDGGVGIGTNGIVVVDFVATAPLDTTPHIGWASATGYPAPNMLNQLTISISTSPCTLYAPSPGSATDQSPFVTFGVGAVNGGWASGPQDVSLTPGVRYYINVAGRSDVSASSPYGTATCVPGRTLYPYCDLRLEFSKPQGH